MLGNGDTIGWLTPHAAVAKEGRVVDSWFETDLGLSYHVYFNVDGKDIVALARSPDHLLEGCDVLLRLLLADGSEGL